MDHKNTGPDQHGEEISLPLNRREVLLIERFRRLSDQVQGELLRFAKALVDTRR
ncbi:hypothetical protein [Pseudomonas jilinensis]|uniref:hypothetical protein n=1 Tax=Pseudomonas jilinensis TaxID=2078689 RepID=UPI0013EF5B3B|nr:hypothetical protein [Pseudomonas jilinensis]